MLANRFEILAELGQGSMGAVSHVRDTVSGQEAALKRIQMRGPITPELRLRFKEEFRAMAKLRHPNTITVYDYGQLDAETQFLTMELVPGVELADRIREAAMPFDEIYKLLIQLLQALGFIHSRLYVHRDIKAQNIRVREDGTLKLMDFGLMSQLGLVSRGSTVSGTPGYLPPEVVKGGVINAASDLYSVGCLAYEMITGRLPFEGRLIEVVRAHVTTAPPPLSRFRAGVPEGLERIVMRLLAKDQEARYQQAQEVIAELSDLAGVQGARENLAQKQSYLTSSVLVGRAHELDQLELALEETAQGVGAACFVGAPAGVGKSRLVQELLLHAKLKDMIVLEGQCLESGAEPYEPIASALRPLIAHASPEELARFGPALTRLFPELPRRWGEALGAGEPGGDRTRLHDAVVGWLQAVSTRQPVVLFLDDLQWADPQSVELLNHVIMHVGRSRVFSLATLRSDETPPTSPVWLTVLEGLTQYLKLQPFNQTQVLSFVEATLKDVVLGPEFHQFLYTATSGNAFYLTELLRYLMEVGVLTLRDGVWHFPTEVAHLELPDSVEATVLRRLGRLSDRALALARAASVLGRHQDRGMWLAVGRLEEEAFFATVDELVEGQFILKEDGHYTFPHDRVREVLYQSIDDEERRDLHERSGLYLEAAYADKLEGVLNDVAHHFGRGRDRVKAYAYTVSAADQARSLGAIPVAVDRWCQAEAHLAAIDYPGKTERLAELWGNIGSYGFNLLPAVAVAAIEKLLAVLEHPQAAAMPGNLLRRIEANSLLAGAYGFSGQPRKGLEVAERTLHLMPPSETPLYGAMLATFCSNMFPAGTYDVLVTQARRAGELLIGKDLTGEIPLVYNCRIGAAAYQMAVAYQGERPDERLLEYALWATEQNRAYSLMATTRHFPAIWQAWTGRLAEVSGYIETSTQTCRRIGAPPSPYVLYLRPLMLHQRGEHEEAMAMVVQALRFPHLAQADFARHLILVLKGQVHLALGELDEAEATFAGAEAHAREQAMQLIEIQARLGRAQLALARGQEVVASELLGWVVAATQAGPARNPLHEAIARRLQAEAAMARGAWSEAEEAIGRALAIVTRPEQDNLLEQGLLHRAQADAARSRGAASEAEAAYRRAAESFHRIRNRHLLHSTNERLAALATPGAVQSAELAIPEAPRDTAVNVPAWARDWGSGGSFRQF